MIYSPLRPNILGPPSLGVIVVRRAAPAAVVARPPYVDPDAGTAIIVSAGAEIDPDAGSLITQ